MVVARKRFAGIALLAVLCAACAPVKELRQFHGKTMGTTYQVTYVDASNPAPPTQKEIDSLLAEINQSLSIYIDSAVISKLNASMDTETWHPVDSHFTNVFRKSQAVYKDTNGAFNPAMAPLVIAWGFGPRRVEELPSDETIESLLKLVSFEAFDFRDSPPAVRKRIGGAQLDFGGIAKGYGVDAIAALLDQRGVQDYLVEIAGEVRARGHRPEGKAWRVGIERPATNPLAGQRVQRVVLLDNAAVSTSGNYRNFQDKNGRKMGHILNPKTGRPAENNLLSATVFARDAITADAYATALMVMGLDDAMSFVESRAELAAYFTATDSDGGFVERSSSRFPAVPED